MSWIENNNPQNTQENTTPDISKMYEQMHQEQKWNIIQTTQADLGAFIKTANLPALGLSVPSISDIYGKNDDGWKLTLSLTNDLPSVDIENPLNDDAETWWAELRYESKANREFWLKYSVLTAKDLGEQERDQLINDFESKIKKIPAFADLFVTPSGQRIDKIEAWYMEEIINIDNKKFKLSASIWWYWQIYWDFLWKEVQDAIHDWLDRVTYDDLEYKKISWLSLWIAGSAHLVYNLDDTFSLYTSWNWRMNIAWAVKDTAELQVQSWGIMKVWKWVSLNLGLVWNYVNYSSGHGVVDYIEQDQSTWGLTAWVNWDINEQVWIAFQIANDQKWRGGVNDTGASIYWKFK